MGDSCLRTDLAGEATTTPGTHVALFVGEHPCNKDGTEIAQIKHSSANKDPGRFAPTRREQFWPLALRASV